MSNANDQDARDGYDAGRDGDHLGDKATIFFGTGSDTYQKNRAQGQKDRQEFGPRKQQGEQSSNDAIAGSIETVQIDPQSEPASTSSGTYTGTSSTNDSSPLATIFGIVLGVAVWIALLVGSYFQIQKVPTGSGEWWFYGLVLITGLPLFIGAIVLAFQILMWVDILLLLYVVGGFVIDVFSNG